MASQDISVNANNNNYVTVELLNAHMSRMEALMEKNMALIRADIADFRTELKQDIANVRVELKQEIAVLDRKVEVNGAKIDALYHWNYWIISLLLVVFFLPHVVEGFKAFFRSLSGTLATVFTRRVQK